MKILVGYEGSAAGDAAIADLSRAGLPAKGDATVFTVADVWPSAVEKPSPQVLRAIPYVAQARERAQALLVSAGETARRGAGFVRAALPGWRVTAESVADSPAWAIFKKARDGGADLVVVGSREKSRLARWALGSVSHKVLTDCQTSVRVGRERTAGKGPYRILLAVDGSSDAERAVVQVLDRNWPASTLVRVVAVADDRLRHAPVSVPALKRWAKPDDADPRSWLGRLVESVERRLIARGLLATGRVREGDPKKVLVDQSVRWKADVIFMGARGLTLWERVLLGSVSSAVAVRASCAVEVVRSLSQKGRGK
ncbi:MAG: universal stress protein [Elusimicrobia bacterium]|jgi:nucleotide-binding universal stress UspA family protein|nr:universal stress protein [Elusimicrobiota bacterium]